VSSIGYPDDMALVGTVGVAATYSELRLEEVPEMGYNPLGHPSRGEICIRGKTLFSGYYKDPELTNQVIIDGWFHTGGLSLSLSLSLSLMLMRSCTRTHILADGCFLFLTFVLCNHRGCRRDEPRWSAEDNRQKEKYI
jgi:acyl-CoA synthetase (AMP-forming)/AMP-acid ligase II